jgi:zinc D-Ala-D-Ala dipeptidase
MDRISSLAFIAATLAVAPVMAGDLPAGFVYLRDVAPTIAQDMRYAGYDNFTGRPLPGYQAGECVLRRAAALALARVQADLARQHLSLKTYDCYRPTRAVRAFWRWANDARSGGSKRFYPQVPKSELFARGYIASHSRHSTGATVDLTLIALPPRRVAPFERSAHYGPCTGPAAQRAPDNSIDMGTGFDCFDRKSYTGSAAVTPAQRHWRHVLKSAMAARGFRNYFREWWHYEFSGSPRRIYDFPILPRPSSANSP